MKKLKTTVKKSNKKRVSKNDIGYGVKVKALEDMGLKNSEFDTLNDMFGNPVEEFEDLMDDVFDVG
jgi:hypothetical protein|tara:strand:+ start:630 stop:827 length:198 start_codon:yes stop_codon:yes gene_type:complete